jgi:hypothetical protein
VKLVKSKTSRDNIDLIITKILESFGDAVEDRLQLDENNIRTVLHDFLPINSVYRKKSKRNRDPNEPKRPVTGYIIFSREKRPEVSKNISEPTEITKKLGQMWNNLSDAEKKPYLDLQK